MFEVSNAAPVGAQESSQTCGILQRRTSRSPPHPLLDIRTATVESFFVFGLSQPRMICSQGWSYSFPDLEGQAPVEHPCSWDLLAVKLSKPCACMLHIVCVCINTYIYIHIHVCVYIRVYTYVYRYAGVYRERERERERARERARERHSHGQHCLKW